MQTILPSEDDLKKKLFHKQSVLISDQQKFPQLFKWKTATLILGSISAILLIVLLVIVYNIEAEEQVPVNLTFLSSIALQSKILQNKQQLINLSKNFQSIYGTTKFENAQLIHSTKYLDSGQIRYNIYNQENEKLLFIVEINIQEGQNTETVRFSIFMNSQFPLPQDQDFNSYINEYYSFETKDERKSSLLGLYNDKYLKLYSTNPAITSITQCKNYKYAPKNNDREGSFSLLQNSIYFSFDDTSVTFNTDGWKCFDPPLQDEQDMKSMLKNMLYPTLFDNSTEITLSNLEVYYLS